MCHVLQDWCSTLSRLTKSYTWKHAHKFKKIHMYMEESKFNIDKTITCFSCVLYNLKLWKMKGIGMVPIRWGMLRIYEEIRSLGANTHLKKNCSFTNIYGEKNFKCKYKTNFLWKYCKLFLFMIIFLQIRDCTRKPWVVFNPKMHSYTSHPCIITKAHAINVCYHLIKSKAMEDMKQFVHIWCNCQCTFENSWKKTLKTNWKSMQIKVF